MSYVHLKLIDQAKLQYAKYKMYTVKKFWKYLITSLILCLHNDFYLHGLRTPNEGINQRYLKNWADVADKICFGRT